MKSDNVIVEKIQTVDRDNRDVELLVAVWQGQVLSVDVYTLIPSVRIDQIYFQIEVVR